MKIDTEDKKKIEYYFKYYFDKKDTMECAEDFIVVSLDKVIADNKETAKQYLKWMRVIDKTVKKFVNTEKHTLLIRRFCKKEKEVTIFMSMFIDRSTYYLWQHEIYEYAYVVAVSEQLLEVK